jgi:hypothetical protein
MFLMDMEQRVGLVVRGRPGVRDPLLFWLGRIGENSRVVYAGNFRRFLVWLNQRPEWLGVDAQGLLERQSAAQDPYLVLDLLQEYVSELNYSRRAKAHVYSVVRSFFAHNRCALPADPSFRITSSKPPVMPKLALQHIEDIVKAAGLRDRSMILVRWQSLQDSERLTWMGKHSAEQIVTQIRQGVHPVRIDLPERKMNQNEFYTLIGKDAVDALVAYFENERGWPKPKEPIWLNTGGRGAVTAPTFRQAWLRLTRRIGVVPKKKGSPGVKYGYNPHDTRHIAKSLLHTHAKAEGFDMDCAEFWLGHTVDPLGYDKFYLDQEYVRKQYLIAERYLNILSSPIDARRQEDQERIRQLEGKLAKVEELEKALLEMKQLVQKSIR